MNKSNLIKDDIKEKFNEFKLGTKKMFKEFFNKETNKKQRANMWTFSRLIIPFITLISSICAICISSPILFTTTGVIAGFGAITDYFDGKSSRKHNSVSDYGKLLDQITDKFFSGIIGINLLFLNPSYAFILLGELLIAGINIGYKVKYRDLDIESSKIGKLKQWPLFLSLALGFLSPINNTLHAISNISIIITTLFQFATAHSYITSNNEEINKLKKIETQNIILEVEEEKREKEKVIEYNNSKTYSIEDYKKLKEELTSSENIVNIQKKKKL